MSINSRSSTPCVDMGPPLFRPEPPFKKDPYKRTTPEENEVYWNSCFVGSPPISYAELRKQVKAEGCVTDPKVLEQTVKIKSVFTQIYKDSKEAFDNQCIKETCANSKLHKTIHPAAKYLLGMQLWYQNRKTNGLEIHLGKSSGLNSSSSSQSSKDNDVHMKDDEKSPSHSIKSTKLYTGIKKRASETIAATEERLAKKAKKRAERERIEAMYLEKGLYDPNR